MPKKGRPETLGFGDLPADVLEKARSENARPIQFKPEAVVGAFAPIPELISEIEKLLEFAKTGKLRAAAWAVVYEADSKPDGEVAHGWARGPYTAFGLTAAVERLTYHWKKHEYE